MFTDSAEILVNGGGILKYVGDYDLMSLQNRCTDFVIT
jgi:hypothetical protein